MKFVISTNAVDRDQDTINQTGWTLDNYKRNPVVLWGHDTSSLPVGKAVEIGLEDGNLTATVEFVPESVPIAGQMAEAVHQLLSTNYLGAVSVGFKPIEWDFSADPDRSGYDFKSQDLLEFSIVAVPSNPNALVAESEEPKPIPDGMTDGVSDEPDSEELLNINHMNLKMRLLMKTRLLGISNKA